MDLNEIRVFIKVVQTGSFSKAARELDMPISTVSTKVSSLEQRLGVTLMQRTTRKLNVTPVGLAYFTRCLEGLARLQEAETDVLAIQNEPQGVLRLTAPAELGNELLVDVISKFLKKYPKMKVDVLLTDRIVDLLGEGVDLAVRAGELEDSSFMAKKIGIVHFALFASSAYIRQNGAPSHPRELAAHKLIRYSSLGSEWRLLNEKAAVKVPVSGPLAVNDLKMVKLAALNGEGIALMPAFFCFPEVKAGKLRHVLPDWHTQKSPVHFVYPAQKFVAPKLTAFLELSFESLKAAFSKVQA